MELYRRWESFETLCASSLLELRYAVPCLSRVSGLTGLMKVRLWGVLSLPQLNLNTRERVSRSDVRSDIPHLKSWNSLVLHVLSVFDERQAAGFYCVRYTSN